MFLWRLFLVGVLNVVLGVSVFALEVTPEAEAPSIESTFQVLEDGVPVEGTFTPEMTMQLYLFFGTEGDTITVTMEAISDGLDPFLMVLGPRGELLAIDDDSAGNLDAQVSDVVLPADDLYVVVATTPFSGHSNGSIGARDVARYTLKVVGNTPPASLLGQTVNLMGSTLTYGVPLRGRITPEEPIFYFVFKGAAGDVVTIEMESSDFDTLLYLFDETGQRIAVNDDAASTSVSRIESLELPTTGFYLVAATLYELPFLLAPEEGWPAGEGRFTIRVTHEN